MCSHFIVGNKIFCFFKKLVFAFLDEGMLQGWGTRFSKSLRQVDHKVGEGKGSLTDLELFVGGLGKKG